MPGRIQTRPLGFLSALGLKSSGQNPPTVDDEAKAVYELSPHYHVDKLDAQSVSGTSTTNGDTLDLTIPQGEAWQVISCQYGLTPAAGASLTLGRLALLVGWNQNSIRVDVGEVIERSIVANQSILFAWNPQWPVLLPPGSTLTGRVEVAANYSGTINFNVAALFHRFEV